MIGLVAAVVLGAAGFAWIRTGGTSAPDNLAELAAARAADAGVSRSLDRSANPSMPPVTASPSAPSPSVSPPRSAAQTFKAAPPEPKPTAPKPTAAVPVSCTQYDGNQRIACTLLPSFGFGGSQMSPLVKLWIKESNWNHTAENSSSGAYGIPQALPGSKMGSVASDWRDNPATQIKWGLGYIKDRYGSPSAAWSFWQSHSWY